MSTRPARLAPIFRSDAQLGILTVTYLEPDRRFTISELVARLGRPQPTVAREVERLSDAGWVDTELVRGRRLVWADSTSLIFPELHGLLLKTTGPKPVLEQELSDIEGVLAAYVYGSWAGRSSGVPGGLPQDIDVLVIGRADLDVVDLRRRTDTAGSRLARDVNVTVLSQHEWDDATSGFLQHVRSGPLVPLLVPVVR